MEIKRIIEIISEEALCEALNVKPRSIVAARQNGKFTASWAPVVRMLAARYNLEVPDEMFTFKQIDRDTAA